jgi:hypothetical protein
MKTAFHPPFFRFLSHSSVGFFVTRRLFDLHGTLLHLDLYEMEMTVLYLTELVILDLDLNEQKNEYVRQ